MKVPFLTAALVAIGLFSSNLYAQTGNTTAAANKTGMSSKKKKAPKKLYMDVHHMGAGNVTFKAVADAHKKDLAVQGKYNVQLIKYWVDETKGDVYCLASANSPEALRDTHAEAHGLLPSNVYEVSAGQESAAKGNDFFLDLHQLGAGKVTAKDVAGAHLKDLAVQKKYGANFVNYWVDEKEGLVMCLVQAPDSAALVNAHKEAHGLLPVSVVKVKQGQ
jgi:hypothetical protein